MLGFTHNEQRVLWFLIAGFVTGLCVWVYRAQIQPLPELVADGPEWQEIIAAADSGFQTVESGENAQTIQESGDRFKINVNTASADALIRIPGIGSVTAERIVEYRNSKGPFQSPEKLKEVRGIGPKTYEKIKPYIFIDPMKEER